MGDVLTRAVILAGARRPPLQLPVEAWGGGVVLVRSMTGREREAWELAVSAQKEGSGEFMALVVAHTTVDEAGALLFTTADVAVLAEQDGAALMQVYKAAMAWNKLGREVDAAKGN